jgi:hypothetical protein
MKFLANTVYAGKDRKVHLFSMYRHRNLWEHTVVEHTNTVHNASYCETYKEASQLTTSKTGTVSIDGKTERKVEIPSSQTSATPVPAVPEKKDDKSDAELLAWLNALKLPEDILPKLRKLGVDEVSELCVLTEDHICKLSWQQKCQRFLVCSLSIS